MPVREHVSCGIQYHSVYDLYGALQSATQVGYNFIVAPIVHPRFRREFVAGKAKNRPGTFTRSDLIMSTHDWDTLVAGKISTWINPDSPVESVRRNSEFALNQELSYASHLGLRAILVTPHGADCVNYARCVYSKILGSGGHQPNYNVWVYIPMRSPEDEGKVFLNNLTNGETEEFGPKDVSANDTWQWWNTFRSVCNTDKKVGIVLEMSADLPTYCETQRWLGEPIRCVAINTSLFSTNKKDYPVLPRAHQNLLRKMFKLDIQVVIYGNDRHGNLRYYQQYMDHLWKTQDPDDDLSTFAKGYEDYLQVPLQPLMDNLESSTYEIFEKDPTKYSEYLKAINKALLDMVPAKEKDTRTVVIMVVGAGRGPLVRAAITASKNADRKSKIYAVEKNPNAIPTLFAQQYEMWGDQVTVVSCDMREWNPPEKADIIVSELLGSFGDNELSPECLDGAQKFLKEDGISIPCSYTSYLIPVSAPKLYSEIFHLREKDKHPLTPFETPYVVHLHNHTPLASPQSLFTFVHPNPAPSPDNSRYGKLNFTVPYDCTVHGFAGYFNTVLYKDIILSIHPNSLSPGLLSWFPMFFPLKDPVYMNKFDTVEVHFWRCISKSNVWYEWMIKKPFVGALHNPNGRSYTIGL